MKYPWAVPGAKVVCVNSKPRNIRHVSGEYHPPSHWGIKMPELGAVYTIRGIVLHHGALGLHLSEIAMPMDTAGHALPWDIRRFRPLITQTQEQDVEMFRKIADEPGVTA